MPGQESNDISEFAQRLAAQRLIVEGKYVICGTPHQHTQDEVLLAQLRSEDLSAKTEG